MSDSPFAGMSRREFLAKIAAAVGTAMLASWASPIIEEAYAAPVASGSLQNIEHIVLFMQENHSFNNYFGTRYGVNGFGDMPLNPPPVFQQRGWAPSPTGGGPPLGLFSTGTGPISPTSSLLRVETPPRRRRP
jgi:phospholipase C